MYLIMIVKMIDLYLTMEKLSKTMTLFLKNTIGHDSQTFIQNQIQHNNIYQLNHIQHNNIQNIHYYKLSTQSHYIIVKMFGIHILVFEVLIIIIYGIFIRTGLTTTASSIESALYFTFGNYPFIIAFAVTSIKYKMYDWSTITNYIFITAITLQLSPLFIIFWSSSFKRSFTSTSQITNTIIVVATEALMTILVTLSMFIGLLNHAQIFLLCMIEIIGFCLNFAIVSYGIKAITGGGGMHIYLFGIIFSFIIKRIRFHNQNNKSATRYPSATLKLIALVIMIITWPSFNAITSAPDIDLTSILSTANLKEQAYLQTFLCLISAITTTLGLQIYGQKLDLENFVKSIINTGILVSSSASVIIDPFASLIIGMFGPFIVFFIHRFGEKLQIEGYPIDVLICAILSGIFSSIFCAGRNARTPALSDNSISQGGLQIACLIVSAGMSIIFGGLAGCLLSWVGFFREETNNTDNGYWYLQADSLPMYPDDPYIKQLQLKNEQKNLQNERMNFTLKQSYITSKIKQNPDLGKILKQSVISDENNKN